MTLLRFISIAAASWAILACLGGTAWAFFVTRLKRLSQRADVTRRAVYPPPPPASRPRLTDDLLVDQPVDVWLTPELSDRLFDDLIAMEGLQ